MPIDFARYALYAHPYAHPKEGRVEVCCLECRLDALPLVVWEGERSALNFVMGAVARHEKESHSKVAAASVAA